MSVVDTNTECKYEFLVSFVYVQESSSGMISGTGRIWVNFERPEITAIDLQELEQSIKSDLPELGGNVKKILITNIIPLPLIHPVGISLNIN
jgi:hypothetical protein